MADLPSDISLEERMRNDWDKRVSHDYRYWMSDGVSSDVEMWETGRRDLKILLDGLNLNTAHEISCLEIGCGVGRIVNAAAELGMQVIGVDVSERAINTANNLNKNVNATFLLGNGTTLEPLKNNSIDLGISFAALGSTPSKVTAMYLAELSRVLKIGGNIRLQVYLGQEQDIAEEDTLALRSYDTDRFIAALELAGFEADYIKELKLSFEVSDFDKGIIAYVIGGTKIKSVSANVEEIQAKLKGIPERKEGSNWKGSLDAHYVALARANQQLEMGDIEAAKNSIEIANNEYLDSSMEAKELVKKIDLKSILLINSSNNINSDFSAISTSEGSAIIYKGICLSHQNFPKKAANAWAKRTLSSLNDKINKIILLGLGDGNFALALKDLFFGELIIFESDTQLLSYLPKEIVESFNVINTSEEIQKLINEDVQCVTLPAVPFYNKPLIEEVKLLVNSRKYASLVNPKIGIVGPFAGGTLPIAEYIQRALKTLGKDAEYINLSQFNPMFMSFSKILSKRSKQSELENSLVNLVSDLVLNIVEEKNLDIVISVAQAPLSPAALDKLREKGVITAHWFMEDTRRFHSWKQIAKHYDYFFMIQKGESLDEVIHAGGTRVKYLPLACDPEIHRPLNLSISEKQEFGSKVSFVGAGYNNRLHVFSKFADLDFKIWGSDWPNATPFDRLVQRQGARVSVDDYIKVFSASDINLNLHSSQERNGVDPSGDFINPRVFELAACGAFQLSDNRTLLPELFEIGSEVITFSHESEIKPLISHYLKNSEERKLVIDKARKKVLQKHTYAHRLNSILDQIIADFGQHLINKSNTSPWQKTLKAANEFPELKILLEKAKNNHQEPSLDSLVQPFLNGKDDLNQTEQKLLFMHHMRSQITHINKLRNE